MREICRGWRRWTGCAGLLVLAATAACSPRPDAAPAAQAPAAQKLWGDMKPVVSVKELMKYTIDPLADNVFLAVGSITTKDGTVDTEPRTEADWEKVRVGAVTLAETAYLLKVPRPFAPAGDLNNSTGPDAVELSPTAIAEKVEKDPVEWNARIEALRNAALEVIQVVDKKDVAELWNASEDLDTACEACHRSYWYPGENSAFYGRLRRRLEDMNKQKR
jgi:cytochrome c556